MDVNVRSFIAKLIPQHDWSQARVDNLMCYTAGRGSKLNDISKHISGKVINFNALDQLLRDEKDFFSCFIAGEDFIFAAVDRIKSYPLFYGIDDRGQLFVSNCPYYIKEAASLNEIDHEAMLGFSMTSYTLGNAMLYQSLYQLQAGEYLLWERRSSKLTVRRYYRYLPRPDKTLSRKNLIEEQASLMDQIVDRTIAKAEGRPICLPLSGGLDSRILLTKLVEKKADAIQAITYGVRGNFEAKMAKHVAEQLKVPWSFIPAKPRSARKLYHTKERFNYAKMSSGLHTVPLYMEYEVFSELRKNKLIPKEAMIVNGQSGDFITGGHLPKLVYDKESPSFDDLFQSVVKKHCSLWSQLLDKENLDYIKQEVMRAIPEVEANLSSREKLLSQYESWEWQERQCKAVIKGQRLYDFYGYSWDLPLWDFEWMDFWAKVPFDLKYNQELYIEYLQTCYPKLFTQLRPVAKPWTLKFKWIPLIAQCYGLVLGRDKKSDYYKRMYYYATDYNQYALIGRKYYLSHYKKTHGLGPFLVSLMLDELGILKDSKISETKPLSLT